MKQAWVVLVWVAISALAPTAGVAQEPIKATTFAGKPVLLYPDGTWKPATTDAGSAAHLGATAEPQQVTLYSRHMYDDYMKATFSFKYGIRDDPDFKLTRNQWDLIFDNGDGGFWVGLGQEERSRIVDLGELAWSGLKKVPVVAALPEGARSGPVAAVQDHMYVVHTRNAVTDLYSVFRVDWLEPGNQCVISWVNVPSPEAGPGHHGPN